MHLHVIPFVRCPCPGSRVGIFTISTCSMSYLQSHHLNSGPARARWLNMHMWDMCRHTSLGPQLVPRDLRNTSEASFLSLNSFGHQHMLYCLSYAPAIMKKLCRLIKILYFVSSILTLEHDSIRIFPGRIIGLRVCRKALFNAVQIHLFF